MASTLFQYNVPVVYRGVGTPNMMQRLRLADSAVDNALLFHRYIIVDGDRPDTIAAHYYGSALYDWVVALSNQTIDLYNEWPLTQEELDDSIKKDYGSTTIAASSIHHYRLDRNVEQITEVEFNALPATLKKYWTKISTTGNILYNVRPSDITITPSSYTLLDGGEEIYWEPVSTYDHMFALNEAKRAIKLIDSHAVPHLEKALRLESNA